MAKVSFFSPESHRFAVEQFAKAIGCEVTVEGPEPTWKQQHFRTYRMELTKEQSKQVRVEFGGVGGKIDSLIKAITEGYKALLDEELAGVSTPGATGLGEKLKAMIQEKA